jgi:hypothetical protein
MYINRRKFQPFVFYSIFISWKYAHGGTTYFTIYIPLPTTHFPCMHLCRQTVIKTNKNIKVVPCRNLGSHWFRKFLSKSIFVVIAFEEFHFGKSILIFKLFLGQKSFCDTFWSVWPTTGKRRTRTGCRSTSRARSAPSTSRSTARWRRWGKTQHTSCTKQNCLEKYCPNW